MASTAVAEITPLPPAITPASALRRPIRRSPRVRRAPVRPYDASASASSYVPSPLKPRNRRVTPVKKKQSPVRKRGKAAAAKAPVAKRTSPKKEGGAKKALEGETGPIRSVALADQAVRASSSEIATQTEVSAPYTLFQHPDADEDDVLSLVDKLGNHMTKLSPGFDLCEDTGPSRDEITAVKDGIEISRALLKKEEFDLSKKKKQFADIALITGVETDEERDLFKKIVYDSTPVIRQGCRKHDGLHHQACDACDFEFGRFHRSTPGGGPKSTGPSPALLREVGDETIILDNAFMRNVTAINVHDLRKAQKCARAMGKNPYDAARRFILSQAPNAFAPADSEGKVNVIVDTDLTVCRVSREWDDENDMWKVKMDRLYYGMNDEDVDVIYVSDDEQEDPQSVFDIATGKTTNLGIAPDCDLRHPSEFVAIVHDRTFNYDAYLRSHALVDELVKQGFTKKEIKRVSSLAQTLSAEDERPESPRKFRRTMSGRSTPEIPYPFIRIPRDVIDDLLDYLQNKVPGFTYNPVYGNDMPLFGQHYPLHSLDELDVMLWVRYHLKHGRTRRCPVCVMSELGHDNEYTSKLYQLNGGEGEHSSLQKIGYMDLHYFLRRVIAFTTRLLDDPELYLDIVHNAMIRCGFEYPPTVGMLKQMMDMYDELDMRTATYFTLFELEIRGRAMGGYEVDPATRTFLLKERLDHLPNTHLGKYRFDLPGSSDLNSYVEFEQIRHTFGMKCPPAGAAPKTRDAGVQTDTLLDRMATHLLDWVGEGLCSVYGITNDALSRVRASRLCRLTGESISISSVVKTESDETAMSEDEEEDEILETCKKGIPAQRLVDGVTASELLSGLSLTEQAFRFDDTRLAFMLSSLVSCDLSLNSDVDVKNNFSVYARELTPRVHCCNDIADADHIKAKLSADSLGKATSYDTEEAWKGRVAACQTMSLLPGADPGNRDPLLPEFARCPCCDRMTYVTLHAKLGVTSQAERIVSGDGPKKTMTRMLTERSVAMFDMPVVPLVHRSDLFRFVILATMQKAGVKTLSSLGGRVQILAALTDLVTPEWLTCQGMDRSSLFANTEAGKRGAAAYQMTLVKACKAEAARESTSTLVRQVREDTTLFGSMFVQGNIFSHDILIGDHVEDLSQYRRGVGSKGGFHVFMNIMYHFDSPQAFIEACVDYILERGL